MEDFFTTSNGPSRAYAALNWAYDNLNMGINMKEVMSPTGRPGGNFGMRANQAPVSEPAMSQILEGAIVEAYKAGNTRWLALASGHMSNICLLYTSPSPRD